MAEVFGHVSVQYLDALGVTVSAPVYANMDNTKTILQAENDAATLISSLDSITDSQIVGAKLVIDLPPVGGIKTAPVSTAENERTGVFNFSQSGSPYKYGAIVPAIADSKITGGKIDLTDTQIGDFITLLTTAGTVFTYVSTAIKALVALIDALLSFRKHRKPESRRSFEVA